MLRASITAKPHAHQLRTQTTGFYEVFECGAVAIDGPDRQVFAEADYAFWRILAGGSLKQKFQPIGSAANGGKRMGACSLFPRGSRLAAQSARTQRQTRC